MLGLGNTLSGGIVPAAAADNPVHDFTTGSVPTGWLEVDVSWYTPAGYGGDLPQTSWADPNAASSGNYYWIRGDASNGRTHYPLRYATALQGDYLFQLSFHAGDVTCRDWGVAVSPDDASAAADALKWRWAWAPEASRVAVQANCPNATIYGTSASSAMTGNHLTGSGGTWYTYHIYHRPSVPSTTLVLTEAQNDWELGGSTLGSEISIAETIVGEGVDYWFGIGGDFDPTSAATAWAKASAARITAL